MMIGRTLGALLAAAVVSAPLASADILVLKDSTGRLFITNLGQKAGYRLISRHREFRGSSGLGLHSAHGGDPTRFEEAVRRAAAEVELDPSLVKAVIRAESNFDPLATSVKGAMGLMQLMPDTARLHAVRDAYDPEQNIAGGTRHLRYLMDRYRGDLDLVLAAYNAGTRPVDEVKGIPNFAETREYVRRVRQLHLDYRAGNRSAAARRPLEVLAQLKRERRAPEEMYGVPIVLRDAAVR